MKFPNRKAYIAQLALGLLAIAAISCSTNRTEFDPYGNTYGENGGNEKGLVDMSGFTDIKRSGVSADLLKPPSEVYRIGSGDILTIERVEFSESAQQCVVMPDGMVYYNIAPGVHAAGKTIPELEEILADSLRADFDFPVIGITLNESRSQTFSVLGEVGEPGVYSLDRPTRLLDAISRVGGPRTTVGDSDQATDIADLENAVIVRNEKVIPINVSRLIKKGDMTQNIYVRPGDTIFVPAVGSSQIHVLGACTSPGSMPYSGRSTVITSLAQAGGLRKGAYKKVLIIRDALNSPKVASLNINNVIQGLQPDIRLRANDILWIPDRPWLLLESYADIVLTTVVTSIAASEGTSFGEEAFGYNSDQRRIARENDRAVAQAEEREAAAAEEEARAQANAADAEERAAAAREAAAARQATFAAEQAASEAAAESSRSTIDISPNVFE